MNNNLAVNKVSLQLSQVREQVNSQIEEFCQTQIVRAHAMSPIYADLWESIQRYFAGGGKRIRPYLTLLAYEAYGGQQQEVMVQVSSAWELLHGCLLMHDDIIDRDFVRHGQLNVSGDYKARYSKLLSQEEATHYANGAALLAGDMALSAAYRFVFTSQLTDSQKILAMSMLDEAIFVVGGGELLDMEASLLPVGAVNPNIIAEQKTANYSFVSPMMMGAILAGASEEQIELLKQFGMAVGTGYQLVDDLLGVFGDETVTGKPVTSDLREGKRTVLLSKTYELVTDEQRQFIDRISRAGSTVTDDDAALFIDLAVSSGAKAAVEQEIDVQKKIASETLQNMGLEEDYVKAFESVISMALERNT